MNATGTALAASVASASATPARIPRLALYLPLQLSTILGPRNTNSSSVWNQNKDSDHSSPQQRQQVLASSSHSLPSLWSSSSPIVPLSAILDSIQQLNKDNVNVDNGINTGSNFSNNNNKSALLFAGVEASLQQLGSDDAERKDSCELLRSAGLNLIVNIDTTIQPSELDTRTTRTTNIVSNTHSSSTTTTTTSSVTDRVESFESQLDAVSNLGKVVAHINCRDYDSSRRGMVAGNKNNTATTSFWNEDTALEYLIQTVPLSAQFLEDHPHVGKRGNETDVMGGSPPHLTGISHETTTTTSTSGCGSGCAGTNRMMMHNPIITRYLLEVLPPLRLSIDDGAGASFTALGSHPYNNYSRGGSRSSSCSDHNKNNNNSNIDPSDNYDGDNDNEAETFSLEILPHIDLIRTTMKTTTVTATAIQPHTSSLWKDVWTRKAARGVEEVFMILEDDVAAVNNATTKRQERLKAFARGVHECFDGWSSTTASRNA